MNNRIEIVEYEEGLAKHFHDLNKSWLEKYFAIEPIDEEMLGDPKKFYIDKGGYIFFARLNDAIVGTFALLKASDEVYELSKMAVDEKYQGRRIGNQLLDYCVQKAKESGMKKIILYSNTLLGPAIHLYRKFGFVEVPMESSEYKRSNIKMEVDLPPAPLLQRGAGGR